MSENTSENTQVYKVFVGNVPFKCNKEEFVNLFKNLNGYVNADVIKRYQSDITRGFGFVSFDTKENADVLLSMNEMSFSDRTLRFSEYSSRVKEPRKNLVFVRNVPKTVDVQNLKNTFSNYGEVKGCVLNKHHESGEPSGTCVIEFTEVDSMLKVLNERQVPFEDENLDVYKFRKKTNPRLATKHSTPETKNAYKAGFKAGKRIGYQEGLRKSTSVQQNN
jgi:RNA recognition motif-containing protein